MLIKMGTYTPEQYRKVIRGRFRNVVKRGRATANTVATFMVNRAKINAPRKTGKLASSIRKRKTKNGYTVSAGYKGDEGFNVARFTNQEFVVTPELPRGKAARYLKVEAGTPVMYGQHTGAEWTARVYPWWDKAVMDTRKQFGEKVRKQVKIALRG